MDEMNDRIRQRWQDRRQKNFNWKKLIVMVLALVLIILAMRELGKKESDVYLSEQDSPQTEVVEEVEDGNTP